MPEAKAERHRVIDTAMAESDVFRVRALFGEWCAKQHRCAAEEVFEEIRGALLPDIEELAEGSATLDYRPEFVAPDY